MSSLDFANRVIKQINTINRHALASWGFRKASYSDESFGFYVNGSKTRPGARIEIRINGNDLYDIDLFRVENTMVVYDEQLKNIYAEQLVDVIDGLVG